MQDPLSVSNLDLIRLFKLVGRVPNAVNPLKDIVENHIHEMGLNAIARISEDEMNVNRHLMINSFRLESSSFVFRIRKFMLKLFWMCIRSP